MIVNGLDKIYDVVEKILGWFGADTANIRKNWTESGLKNGWNCQTPF